MSTASFVPAYRSPDRGASAAVGDTAHRHILGDALRVIRVYAETAFRVAVLGEYQDWSPVRRD